MRALLPGPFRFFASLKWPAADGCHSRWLAIGGRYETGPSPAACLLPFKPALSEADSRPYCQGTLNTLLAEAVSTSVEKRRLMPPGGGESDSTGSGCRCLARAQSSHFRSRVFRKTSAVKMADGRRSLPPGQGFRSVRQHGLLLPSFFTVQVTHYPFGYCTGHPVPE